MLDCNRTNIGEILVYNHLTSNGYNVLDVSKDQQYWTQDIDFIAFKGGRTIKIEVKYDSWINSTRNMFIELLSDVDKNKCGWIDYCKADYLYYVDANSKVCYIVSVDDVRDYLSKYDFRTKDCIDRNSRGTIYKTSRGALVNIDYFSSLYRVDQLQLGE